MHNWARPILEFALEFAESMNKVLSIVCSVKTDHSVYTFPGTIMLNNTKILRDSRMLHVQYITVRKIGYTGVLQRFCKLQ